MKETAFEYDERGIEIVNILYNWKVAFWCLLGVVGPPYCSATLAILEL